MDKIEINEFTLEEQMNFEHEKQTYYEVLRKFILTELSGLELDTDITFDENVDKLSEKVRNLSRELHILANSYQI